MEDLRFYDFNFNLLAIEHKIIASDWKIYFNAVGSAEIHMPLSAKAVPIIFNNKYLLVVQGDKQAIITGKQISDECIIFGKTPNWILSKRVTEPVTIENENCETAVKSLVSSVFSDVDNFICHESNSFSESVTKVFESYTVLSDTVISCLCECNFGHNVYLDIENKRWVFDVLKPDSRLLVISESGLNAYDTKYLFDIQDYFTSGIYKMKEPEYEDVDDIAEIFTEEQNGIFKWTTFLSSEYEGDAKKELDKCALTEEITANTKKIKYQTDYALGDIIKLQFERGSLKAEKQMIIKGINIWCEANNAGEMPVLELYETDEQA